ELPFGVDDTLLDQGVDSGQDVAHVATTEVESVGVDALLSVAGAAAKIRLKDRVTLRREELHDEIKTAPGTTVRSAVRIDQDLVGRHPHFRRLYCQNAVEVPTFTLPAHDPALCRQTLAQEKIAGRCQLLTTLHPARDTLRVRPLRIAAG